MAPLPVIPNCFRVALRGRPYGGVTSVNVFHVLTSTADVEDIAQTITIAANAKDLMSGKPGDSTPDLMTITPLDGVHAASNFAVPTTSWTSSSAAVGDTVPEAAIVLSFRTGLRGPAHRGRMFIGPVVESSIVNGVVIGSVPQNLKDAWDDFVTDLAQASPAMGLAVASYALGTAAPVTSLSVSTQQATQRRRLLQTR